MEVRRFGERGRGSPQSGYMVVRKGFEKDDVILLLVFIYLPGIKSLSYFILVVFRLAGFMLLLFRLSFFHIWNFVGS